MMFCLDSQIAHTEDLSTYLSNSQYIAFEKYNEKKVSKRCDIRDFLPGKDGSKHKDAVLVVPIMESAHVRHSATLLFALSAVVQNGQKFPDAIIDADTTVLLSSVAEEDNAPNIHFIYAL